MIDDLVNIGVSIIGLTGGEPTLRKDIVEITAKSSAIADTMIFTNGFNFTDELARDLKKAKLWAVAVSLDSSTPELHNKKRNSDQAYEKAIQSLEISKKYGFYTMLTTVPDYKCLENNEYKEIYKIAKSLKVDEYRIVEPMPTGRLICSEKRRFVRRIT